jgi:VanZ family protein
MNNAKRFWPPSREFVRYWLPVIVYAALMLVISSIPIRIRRVPFRNYDKVFHFFEYGIYAWLWYRALKGTMSLSSRGRIAIATVLICTAFGIMDELYQVYTPYRTSNIYDLAADASGSFAAVILAVLVQDVFPRS